MFVDVFVCACVDSYVYTLHAGICVYVSVCVSVCIRFSDTYV